MKNNKNRPAVVLVSGGLDSSVVLAMAIERGFAAHALSVRYGQRHAIESSAAKRVCHHLGAQDHKFIDIDLRAFGGSALTDAIAIPKGERPPGADPIPSTYVPARNTVFLSLALSWAEALDAHDVFIGVSAVDYSGYPDCRPEFIKAFEELANLGTRAANGGQKFSIHAPLVNLTKGETVKAGLKLGLDFALTWSCYDPAPGDKPCRECESCQLRAKGFAEAGVLDPALGK